ncbi:MAG TPA: MBL fold metallo-hydrolase [Candidatus Megamonas gallistercoris]|nr:MBL fold metallo-hydrolase [Candidatus Megamonas gallistercoris]
MKIVTLVVGPIMENCYIIYDEKLLEGIIVDPGDEADRILTAVKNLNLTIKYIVNTHAHADHIGANKEIGEKLKAKLAVHADDTAMLTDPQLNLSVAGYMGRLIISQPADILLHEGDTIVFGNCEFKVVHTPGHTPGGICLVGENVVISGDSLFAGSIGRTDFPTGSMTDLISSLKEKIMTLDPNMQVFPGHGGTTNIGWEKQNNPYLA